MLLVVKIGTSSITDAGGEISTSALDKLAAEVAELRSGHIQVVVVTSGAITAGLPALGFSKTRPTDLATLQAIAAVGQTRLMQVYNESFAAHGLVAGQVLLAPLDFVHRSQYLHARQTLYRLLELGVVPVVNENDAVADDEIRYGDNDRLAALVAHLLRADRLVLLTDQPGVFTSDPRIDPAAVLLEEIVTFAEASDPDVGGPGSERGSGGMASKLAAAKIAAWSGVETIIAAATRESVLSDAAAGRPGVGTVVRAHTRRISARKLWIAFAVGSLGTLTVDAGAKRALIERGVSLLPAGIVDVAGSFDADDPVALAGPDGGIFARGLVRYPAQRVKEMAGRQTSQLPQEVAGVVIHRDDLVVLPV
jgi:glutamate 5-kinase